jgi:hypothetical protein
MGEHAVFDYGHNGYLLFRAGRGLGEGVLLHHVFNVRMEFTTTFFRGLENSCVMNRGKTYFW